MRDFFCEPQKSVVDDLNSGVKYRHLLIELIELPQQQTTNPDGIIPVCGTGLVFFLEYEMNQALIGNVARHPAQTLKGVIARPTILADESLSTIEQMVKIWVREGLIDSVSTLVDASGIPPTTNAVLRRICARQINRVVH